MLVRLRDESQGDLLDAAWFYEKKNNGLGVRFIDHKRHKSNVFICELYAFLWLVTKVLGGR